MRPVRIGKPAILEAAEGVLLAHGSSLFTLDAVASGAGCAKGLAHYHFRTRTRLLISTNDRIWDKREKQWTTALRGPSAEECIRQSWSLLMQEATSGVTRAWWSLLLEPDRALAQAVRHRLERFDGTFHVAASALLDGLGLSATIPSDEWSRLLGRGIDGLSLHLVARGRGTSLEAEYSAVWLSALALTAPRSS